MWIVLVAVYALCKGFRDIFKKIALDKNSVMEVLFLYTAASFVMVIPSTKNAFEICSAVYLLPILLKSFVIFLAWLAGFYAMSKMPVSLYGILDLSRVLFSTLFGVIILNEQPTVLGAVGLTLVCCGLLMLKIDPKKKKLPVQQKEKVSGKIIIIAITGCLLNAVSGTLDKILMSKGEITSSQLQYWYCLFLLLMYAAYMIITRTKFNAKSAFKNYWVYLMSAALVIGDKALFIANSYPEAQVTVMTLIKQASCIVIILGGKFIFKEKRIAYKLLCAAVVIAGIVIAVI